jgi:sugar phosphate isomerase/epimerase
MTTHSRNHGRGNWLILAAIFGGAALAAWPAVPAQAAAEDGIFARDNLVAWCIVPFDAQKRGPEARAQMLQRLGLKRLAYDWRDEHIPTFDQEIETMQRHGIEITAWWFPGGLNDTAQQILACFERHQVKTQLWISLGDPAPQGSQAEKVRAAATAIRPIAAAAAKIGCRVALYNHGGWFGEPENQLAIIDQLDLPNVGIVYNLHHGHSHLARFPELLRKMQPHLLAFNLNGMVVDGDRAGKKILTLGEGDQDLRLLKTLRDSGWRGPVGILDHRAETDSEVTLRANLAGLEQLRQRLSATATP